MSEQKLKPERKYYLDIMRIIACFAVVLIHLTSTNTGYISFTEKTLVIFNGITRFSVPLFFMISGALFLSKNNLNIKKIYSKNIFKIIIILAVWLTIYGIFNYYRYGGTITGLIDIKKIIIGFIYNQYHFWFLFPLVAIYISLPILKKISEDKKTLLYFIMLFFTFVIGYESLKLLFGPTSNKVIWISLFRPEIICGYSGYFLLGYYLDTYGINKKWSKKINVLGILSFILVSIGCLYISKVNGSLYTELCNNFVFTSAFMAMFIFINIKKYFAHKEFNKKITKLLSFLSSHTLAVYIFHNLIRYLLEDYGIYSKIIYGPFTLLLVSAMIFITCESLSWVLKKIPIIGKFLT